MFQKDYSKQILQIGMCNLVLIDSCCIELFIPQLATWYHFNSPTYNTNIFIFVIQYQVRDGVGSGQRPRAEDQRDEERLR